MGSKDEDNEREFDITGGVATDGSTLLGVFGGSPTHRYYAEDTETGEKQPVLARDKDEALRKAREGKFEK